MASTDGYDLVLKMLECSICLEKFETPKTLVCSHDFCKTCVEKILEFQPDGSAWITCPMRCRDKTFISKDQVVDSLPTSITLKNMADVLGKDKPLPSGPVCRLPDCEKQVSFHCCGIMRCTSCQKKHDDALQLLPELHDGRARVVFSEKENKLNALCSDHSSNCTHLCEDGKLLCVYCLARNVDHKQRGKNTLETESRLIREALNREFKDTLTTSKAQRDFQTLTQDKISNMKNLFQASLERRKERLLKWYGDLLDTEMKLLTRKLDAMCEEHLDKYPVNITEYYGEKLQQMDVQLVLQKEEVLAAINETKKSSTLICDTIAVVGDMDFLSLHPLGDIEMKSKKKVRMDDLPCSTLDYDFEKLLLSKTVITDHSNNERKPSFVTTVLPTSDPPISDPPTYDPPTSFSPRYNPATLRSTSLEGTNLPFCPASVNDLSIGMKVSVNRSNGRRCRGTVKWIGTIPRHTGDYVGIEVDGDADGGRTDGTYDGVRYFSCQEGQGIFVKFPKVVTAWKKSCKEFPLFSLVDLNSMKATTQYEDMGYRRFDNENLI